MLIAAEGMRPFNDSLRLKSVLIPSPIRSRLSFLLFIANLAENLASEEASREALLVESSSRAQVWIIVTVLCDRVNFVLPAVDPSGRELACGSTSTLLRDRADYRRVSR